MLASGRPSKPCAKSTSSSAEADPRSRIPNDLTRKHRCFRVVFDHCTIEEKSTQRLAGQRIDTPAAVWGGALCAGPGHCDTAADMGKARGFDQRDIRRRIGKI